jgi:hypothetical protein
MWSHILGIKIDECLKCGTIGQHYLVRRSYWISIFFCPVILLRLKHGMICSTCAEWTGIPMLQMIRGTTSGRLPLNRPRPRFATAEPDQFGMRPTVADVMDPIKLNTTPRPSAVYVRVWPALAALVVVALITVSVLFPAPKTPGGQTIDTSLQSKYGQAHDCWDDGTGIVGCKMHNGTLMGTQAGTEKVCYFNEPLSLTTAKLECDK